MWMYIYIYIYMISEAKNTRNNSASLVLRKKLSPKLTVHKNNIVIVRHESIIPTY